MPIIRRTIHVTRKNGGIIKLDVPIHGITGFKVSNIIYEGGDLQKGRSILRLLINDFVRGIELNTPTGSQKYTCIFEADEEGEWEGNGEDFDWESVNDEENPGEKKMAIDIEITSLVNFTPSKDLKLLVELIFRVE